MHSNSVKLITVIVQLEDGDSHTLVSREPGQRGSNSRFVAQQAADGLADLGRRLDDIFDVTQGEQLRRSS